MAKHAYWMWFIRMDGNMLNGWLTLDRIMNWHWTGGMTPDRMVSKLDGWLTGCHETHSHTEGFTIYFQDDWITEWYHWLCQPPTLWSVNCLTGWKSILHKSVESAKLVLIAFVLGSWTSRSKRLDTFYSVNNIVQQTPCAPHNRLPMSWTRKQR